MDAKVLNKFSCQRVEYPVGAVIKNIADDRFKYLLAQKLVEPCAVEESKSSVKIIVEDPVEKPEKKKFFKRRKL